MRLRIGNEKAKYYLTHRKRLDENKVKYPSYIIYHDVGILTDRNWIPYNLRFLKYPNKKTIEISAKPIKNAQSEIKKIFEISKWDNLKLNIYFKLYSVKIKILKFRDKLIAIRKNLYFILLALVLASIYFLANHYWDNYFQDLINNSNLIQSIIMFLSLSSIFNIFHPFTFRKELSKKDIDEISEIKTKKAINKIEIKNKLYDRLNL
jgi:hypothetical protein